MWCWHALCVWSLPDNSCMPACHHQFVCFRQPNHPISIIKNAIYEYFEKEHPGVFHTYDDLYPVVSAKAVRPWPGKGLWMVTDWHSRVGKGAVEEE